MPNPNGAVQAISSGAATTLAVGVAFLSFWGFGAVSGKVAWEPKHLLVLIPGALSYCFLAYVPYIVTRLDNEEAALLRGRRSYGVGAGLLLFAMFVSFVL